MENLEFSEEEIQEQLALLGYKNIPRHRLHEVKQDLDALIRSLTSPKRNETQATRAPPAVTKEKVGHVSSEGFFLHHAGDDVDQQVSSQNRDVQSRSKCRSDSYAQHSVAAKQWLPCGAPSRLHVEPDSDDTLSRDSFGSSPDTRDRRVFRRKVLRKHQGRLLVCDESVYSDDSDMYPNTRVQESDENSLNSSFWSDGDNREEEEVVEIQQVVDENPLNRAAGHKLKEATAQEKPDLIRKSEGGDEQSSGERKEGDQSEGEEGSGSEISGNEGSESEEEGSGSEGEEGSKGEEGLSGGEDEQDEGEEKSGEEDDSEEDEDSEDDGSEAGSCGEDEEDEEHGSEDDEEESCSESEEDRSSPKSSSWSGEEQHVEVEEEDSLKASAHNLLMDAPEEERTDMSKESEGDPSSWSEGGQQERVEQVEDLPGSLKESSEETMGQSSGERKSLYSSEELGQAAGDFKPDVPGDQNDAHCREDNSTSGAEDKGPPDMSEDETLTDDKDSCQMFHKACSDKRTSLNFKPDNIDDDDDDDDGREEESEVYDGSEDQSDEDEDSQDSLFCFDRGHRDVDKEEVEQVVEEAPGDGKTELNIQHDPGEDHSDEYDGSEEESEDEDSLSSSLPSEGTNQNISDTEEKTDADTTHASKGLREVEGPGESGEEDADERFPEDQSEEDDGGNVKKEEEDSFWADHQDKKFEETEEVVDEDLEEERADLGRSEGHSEEDGGEESCSSSHSPAPSLMTSGCSTFLPEDQDHQQVAECDEAEDVEHRDPVEVTCCGDTHQEEEEDDDDEGAEPVQDELSSAEDVKFLDVESSRSLEWDGNLRDPQQGAASSLDDRLSQLHVSERLDSGRLDSERLDSGRLDSGRLDSERLDSGRLDSGRLDDDTRDSEMVDNSLSAFESYVRALTRDDDLRPKPKSFIRPVMTQTQKKTDPVAKYFQYKQLWDLFKAPGERDHKELRWAVKERLAIPPPQMKPRRVHVPNTFTVPTEKKRSALRWRIRTDLANGLIPDQHRF